MAYYVSMTTWIKNVNNFQIAKVSLRVLLSIYLIFHQFQFGVVYKSVAYKKSVYIITTLRMNQWEIFAKEFTSDVDSG